MKIKKMMAAIEAASDEECMEVFLELLAKRVTINTGFVFDDEEKTLTHQILSITCGELQSVSTPEKLEVPLRPATGEELGETVN